MDGGTIQDVLHGRRHLRTVDINRTEWILFAQQPIVCYN
jgi:hypothetical protein